MFMNKTFKICVADCKIDKKKLLIHTFYHCEATPGGPIIGSEVGQ